MLTKDHAEAIAEKLRAAVRKGRKHDIAIVKHNNQTIAQFGIRRGSRRDQGHDHVPGAIHLQPHDAMLLAQCPLSFDDWLAVMKEKGFVSEG